MRSTSALSALKSLGLPVISSRDAAAVLKLGSSAATQMLGRLAADGALVKLGRGKWSLVEAADPLEIGTWITQPYPCYVSLQTALFRHGLISQVPEKTFLVSLDRSKRLKTPVGEFSVHHVSPVFFDGFESMGSRGTICIATAEKALVDWLYLSPSKNLFFKSLPEIEFPKEFSRRKALAWIEKIPSLRTRVLARAKFEQLWAVHHLKKRN